MPLERAPGADVGQVADPAILRLEHLSKRYSPDRPAIFEGVDLELRQGEYLAGNGRIRSRQIHPAQSARRPRPAGFGPCDSLDGTDLSTLDDDAVTLLRRRAVGFVFQAFHVLPYLSVDQNVALPLELLGIAAAERDRRTSEMLAAVGIAPLAERYPKELSGGEVQRIAIARALVHRPRLLLADEPTGNLDSRSAALILALLREQIKANAGAGILITHSRTAADTADRILVLDAAGLHP